MDAPCDPLVALVRYLHYNSNCHWHTRGSRQSLYFVAMLHKITGLLHYYKYFNSFQPFPRIKMFFFSYSKAVLYAKSAARIKDKTYPYVYVVFKYRYKYI